MSGAASIRLQVHGPCGRSTLVGDGLPGRIRGACTFWVTGPAVSLCRSPGTDLLRNVNDLHAKLASQVRPRRSGFGCRRRSGMAAP